MSRRWQHKLNLSYTPTGIIPAKEMTSHVPSIPKAIIATGAINGRKA